MRKKFDRMLAIAAAIAFLTVLLSITGEKPANWPLAAAVLLLPLAVLAVRHFYFVHYIVRRTRGLKQDVRRLELAHGLAEVGHWSIGIESGRHSWSREFRQIASLAHNAPPDPETIAALLGEGAAQFDEVLHRHRDDRTPFAVEFEICRPCGESRMLRARAQNVYSLEGAREQVLLAVRDVTEDYLLVESIARERAEAIEQAREAQMLANTDPLTGLANRRLMMREIDRTLLAARASGGSLSIVMFDIDHFKSVNDRHGHQVGDVVLRNVAELAIGRAGPHDLIARVGGEEFLWLMPGAGAGQSGAAAERLRWTIEAGTLSAPFPAVTISAGNATLTPRDSSLSLFARADAALYEAKRAGRNQVKMAA